MWNRYYVDVRTVSTEDKQSFICRIVGNLKFFGETKGQIQSLTVLEMEPETCK